MSEFDKEAEREKLREKFAREEKEREATEHMSELLLKGATMTNMHCDECGDPIFRSDGQEFCPTCRRPVREAAQDSDQQEAAEPRATEQTSADLSSTPTTPEAESTRQTTNQSRVADQPTTVPEQSPDSGISVTQQADQAEKPRPPASTPSDGTIQDAQASLIRTIVVNAKSAEESNDLQQTITHLQITHEAAQALRSLKGL